MSHSHAQTKTCPKCDGPAHNSGESVGHAYHTYHTANHFHPALGVLGLMGIGKAIYDRSRFTCQRCGHIFFRI